MPDPKDDDRPNDKPENASPEDSPGAAAEGKRSGRVAFDSRGNPIWEWQLQTGVYTRDVTTQTMKKLNLGDLSIAETAIHKQPPGLGQVGNKASPSLSGVGFDPYDNSARSNSQNDPFERSHAPAAKPATEEKKRSEAERPVRPASPPPVRRPAAATPPKPSALQKIGRWFKGKSRSDDDSEYE